MPGSPERRFSRYPLLCAALAFAAGITAGSAFQVGFWPAAAGALLLGCAAVVLRNGSVATGLIAFAFLSAGIASTATPAETSGPPRVRTLYDRGEVASGTNVTIEGVLAREPEATFDGELLTLRTESIANGDAVRPVVGDVRIFVPIDPAAGSELALKYGSRLRVSLDLRREDEYRNPGVMPRRELLDRLNIDATGSVKNENQIEHVRDEWVFPPLAWIYGWRTTLIDEFRSRLEPKTAGIMIATLLGNKHFLDRSTAELFREGGTFHILVISGFHITLIGGIVLLIVRRLTRDRRLQFAVAASLLWAYALAVGAEAPVIRAALMFTVLLYSYVVFRRANLLNSLSLTALVLLTYRPKELFDPSFQLTFVSVGAIVCLAYPILANLRAIGSWRPSRDTPFPPRVPAALRAFCEALYWEPEKWLYESRRRIWSGNIEKTLAASRLGSIGRAVARYAFEGVLVSLIIQLAMLPLSVVYFHRVSLISVLLNLWVGALIAVESLAAVLGAAAGVISERLANGLFRTAEVVNHLMMRGSAIDASWASFRLPAYVGAGRAWYVIFAVAVVAAAYLLHHWKPMELKPISPLRSRLYGVTGVVIAISAVIIVAHPFSAPRPDGRLHVEMIDVGQGDSTLITFPDGGTMLVDGGGRARYRRDAEVGDFEPDVRRIGEFVVSEFLWHRGYSKIDYVVATHEDVDHIQGLTEVVKNFRVPVLLIGTPPESQDEDLSELLAVAARSGTVIQTIGRADVLNIANVRTDILNPPSDATRDPANNRSLVMKLNYGQRSLLLTGDIEREAEAGLLAAGSDLKADVVKVPHHGSRTSSTQDFVDRVAPIAAIIPVGRRSQFGHPHPQVVERWSAAGATVLTTGQSGLISVSTDGSDLVIDTFVR